jgi:hypothetical protein
VSAPAYFSWENPETGEHAGLLRLSADRSTLERVVDGDWQDASDRIGSVTFPGADGPDKIDAELATQLADRYGVELEATPS